MAVNQPVASRPQAPKAYGFSSQKQGMLTWEQVHEALASASLYWIGTTRPDGASHMHPIWGGWVAQTGYFEGGDTTRWARNLARDPRISFGVESDGYHVSGRGTVSKGAAGENFAALTANYQAKYDYFPESDGSFWRIAPELIIAFNLDQPGGFANTPTRFRFNP
jgi:hypothetical protein